MLERYHSLPKGGKPLVRSNGAREFTVLAGVVLESDGLYECIALATGLKAMPDAVVATAKGRILHDSHAEVLAIRALNYFLISESKNERSRYVRNRRLRQFRVHLYISSPPCGDASMSLFEGESWSALPENTYFVRGRDNYNLVGVIRTKPGRRDSPLTLSKSCTDKITLHQVNGLLLGPAAQLLEGKLYLTSLVCPQVLPDFERAFSRWCARRFEFASCDLAFEDGPCPDAKPSPTSIVWTPHCFERLTNGVLQGHRAKPEDKAASRLSRWYLTREVLNLLGKSVDETPYLQWKRRPKFYPRGWQHTAADDFSLDL